MTTVNRSTRARREKGLTPETFARLLDWLDQDRDRAGQRYEQIRSRLIKIFVCRGCAAAEELADETINRVAEKTQQIAGSYVGDPASYFCGVAHKVYLEHTRKVIPRLTALPADVAEKKNHYRKKPSFDTSAWNNVWSVFPSRTGN